MSSGLAVILSNFADSKSAETMPIAEYLNYLKQGFEIIKPIYELDYVKDYNYNINRSRSVNNLLMQCKLFDYHTNHSQTLNNKYLMREKQFKDETRFNKLMHYGNSIIDNNLFINNEKYYFELLDLLHDKVKCYSGNFGSFTIDIVRNISDLFMHIIDRNSLSNHYQNIQLLKYIINLLSSFNDNFNNYIIYAIINLIDNSSTQYFALYTYLYDKLGNKFFSMLIDHICDKLPEQSFDNTFHLISSLLAYVTDKPHCLKYLFSRILYDDETNILYTFFEQIYIEYRNFIEVEVILDILIRNKYFSENVYNLLLKYNKNSSKVIIKTLVKQYFEAQKKSAIHTSMKETYSKDFNPEDYDENEDIYEAYKTWRFNRDYSNYDEATFEKDFSKQNTLLVYLIKCIKLCNESIEMPDYEEIIFSTNEISNQFTTESQYVLKVLLNELYEVILLNSINVLNSYNTLKTIILEQPNYDASLCKM